jgi:hypothetical protein
MKRFNVSANHYNDLEIVMTVQKPLHGRVFFNTLGTGRRVQVRARVRGRRVQRVFSKKKTDRSFSNTYPCSRLPVYTRARVRVVPCGF